MQTFVCANEQLDPHCNQQTYHPLQSATLGFHPVVPKLLIFHLTEGRRLSAHSRLAPLLPAGFVVALAIVE